MIRATLAFEAARETVWDAIVVGAGPAGALAARQLAAAGARVLLVDKKSFPRWKVCGACLNGQALSVLKSVGLGSLAADLGGVLLDAFELRLGGRAARLALPAGVALSRIRLDAALVGAAIDAGSHYLSETQASVESVDINTRRVLLSHHGRTLTVFGRVVLVAAGLGQTCVAGRSSIQTRASAGSRVGAGCVIEKAPRYFEEKTIFMAVGREGYVGLVRVEDGSLNIAAALDRRIVRRLGGPGSAAAAIMAEAGLPQVEGLADAVWQGTVALTRRTSPLAEERLFVLGDAAGYVEPFTGEGIAWSLISAQAVAPLARQGIERWEPSLQRAWPLLHRRLVGRRQRFCRLLAVLLRHPSLARGAFAAVSRIPLMTRLMIEHVNAPAVLSPASYS
jgi:flavin-dependent dehydrogenase